MPEGGLKLAVTGLLGHGGMGSVLLAKQPLIGREVAVKVAHGPDSAEQLLAEARMTGAVEHPGVIPVYGIGSDQRGLPALVMRRVAGMSWRQLLDDAEHPFWAKLEAPGDVRLETNLNLLVQICNTLAAAHARGVIHRDLKPDNILLGEFGELYVADWGIARQLTDSVESSVVGTPAYIAPEMARRESLSASTDVFLIGATLYELLSGRPPWFGADIHEVLTRASRGALEPLPESTDLELAEICHRATAPKPEARYQNAIELRDALTHYLRHRSSVAISQAANRTLATLRTLIGQRADDVQVYAQLSECRFGFTQALREWPENPVAKHGLQEALERGVEFELERHHPDAAKALLLEMKGPPPDLARRVEVASVKQRTSSAQLEAIVANTDNTQGLRRRRVVATVLVVMTFGFIGSGVAWPLLWTHPAALVVSSAVFSSFLLLTLWAVRRAAQRNNWVNQAVLTGLAYISLGAFVVRILGYQYSLNQQQTLSFELCVTGAACAALAVSVHRALAAHAVLSLVTIGLLPLAPLHAHQLYSSMMIVGIVTVASWLRFGKTAVVPLELNEHGRAHVR